MIPVDKAMDFTVAFAMSLIITVLAVGLKFYSQPETGWVCFISSTFMGLLKQCHNKFVKKEKFDFWNLGAMSLGGSLYFFA